MIVGFQNCSNTQFSSATDENVLASINDHDGGDDQITVICDPFSPGSACAPNNPVGLLANVYYYPNGVGVQNYIDHGTLLPILIQLSNLNIPFRKWTEGFPKNDGTLLKDNNGNDLVEYFAMDLKGYLELVAGYTEGDYDFALASDDGAILNIDGQVIVDNDGTHATQWKCSSKSVNLIRGESHSMRVRYYQGPRENIELRVFWRPASMRGQPCGESGGWSIVPPQVLHHRGM